MVIKQQTEKSTHILPSYGALVLAGLSFGSIPVISAIMRDLSASSLEQTFLRLALGCGIALMIIAFYFRENYPIFQRSTFFSIQINYFLQGFLLSLMIIVYLSSVALKTPVGEAALLVQIHPFFTLLLSAIFLREKVTPEKVLALVLALFGVLAITTPWKQEKFFTNLLGDLLASANGLFYSLYLVLGRKNADDRSTIASQLSIAWVLVWGFLTGLPLIFFLTLLPLPPSLGLFRVSMLISPSILILGILLALFGSALPYGLIMYASTHVESSKAAIILLDEPIGAIVFGFLILGEAITLEYIVGGFLLLTASSIIIRTLTKNNHS